MSIIITIFIYFTVLLVLSWVTSRRTSNDAFFRGERKSPWYIVAFGMIGASISGVTFISVPGMVIAQDMTYLQMCLGFIIGYFIVAYILLPVYYRLNLTTIYTYLGRRLGKRSYHTGAWFFLLSKMVGATIKFYIVCILLQRFTLDELGIPFYATVPIMVLLIWLYTRRSGIKTLVWTDSLQTLIMFLALICIIFSTISQLDMNATEAFNAISTNSHSRIFVFDDWASPQNFWKHFLSGIFVVIVMTGLDQDMMQKNLTCRSLKEAQKNLCSYGFAFVPANFLFLALGVLLLLLTQLHGMALPEKGDNLLPMFAATGKLGETAMYLFFVGMVASSFSTADSAITALTTSFCVDICNRPHSVLLRKQVHILLTVIFILSVILFDQINSSSIINVIYTMVGYTYGPLLGLFAFGLTCKRSVRDRLVPYICIASPVLCYLIDMTAQRLYDYHFGYELLMLNGMLTYIVLWCIPGKRNKQEI